MPKLRAPADPVTRKPATVRAIHASAAVHAWYFDELDRHIKRMQAEVEREILAVYGAFEPQTHAMDANPSLLLRAALRKWGGLWVSKFDRLSLDLGAAFARKSFTITQAQMRAALKDAGFTVKFDPTPASRAAYQAVIAEQVNLIKSIPAEYLKAVESNVWGSVMKGGDMHALSTELKKSYGVTRDRAATIARDQNNRAKAIIEKTRREELGITHAIWQHSAGGKVPRKTHVAMSGKAYPLAQGMYDSDAGEYVLPGQLINCRCTSRAIIPAFETIESAEQRAKESPLLRAARGRAR